MGTVAAIIGDVVGLLLGLRRCSTGRRADSIQCAECGNRRESTAPGCEGERRHRRRYPRGARHSRACRRDWRVIGG